MKLQDILLGIVGLALLFALVSHLWRTTPVPVDPAPLMPTPGPDDPKKPDKPKPKRPRSP